MYHPVTTEYGHIGKKIKIIIKAFIKSNKNYIVIYPNNDLGFEIILDEYSQLRNQENFAIYPSMRFEYFLALLKNASFIIGNSSAGIRESCIYGIPTINIGTRQNGRFKPEDLKNIQNVKENVEEILEAINNINKHHTIHKYFGKGDSTKKFMKVISNKNIWNTKLQKKFIDFK